MLLYTINLSDRVLELNTLANHLIHTSLPSNELWRLEPTQENMERYLDELNREIPDEIPSNFSETEALWLTNKLIARRMVYIYLGRFQEAAADVEKIISVCPREEDSEGTISDFEIDAFHYFAIGAEEKGYAALNDLAKEGSALAILFLKIKGKPIPNIEYISYISYYSPRPSIVEDDLFCQGRYEEAIKKIDTYLEKDSDFYGRGNLLALRGVFKAMANDYEGAIFDLDQTIDLSSSSYPFYSQPELAVRGLIHCLNNDPEKAKADFGSIPYTRVPHKSIAGCLGDFNEFKWEALIIEQSLGL